MSNGARQFPETGDFAPFCANRFCADGYSVISASKQHLNMYMIDKDGNIIHEIVKNK